MTLKIACLHQLQSKRDYPRTQRNRILKSIRYPNLGGGGGVLLGYHAQGFQHTFDLVLRGRDQDILPLQKTAEAAFRRYPLLIDNQTLRMTITQA